MRKYYDDDTRLAHIEQIESGKKSVSEAAKELGVTEDMVYRWRKQLANDADHGFQRRPEKAPRHPKHGQY